jgi:uncharacterized protein (TIGR03435 family)
MRHDLDRYFGSTARIERRRVKALVLARRGHATVPLGPSEPLDSTLVAAGFPHGDGKLRVRGSYFYSLQELLEVMLRSPVVDETGLAGTVDLGYAYNELPNELKGIDAYRHALAKYGLVLEAAERAIDFLVIRDHAEISSENKRRL